MGWKTNLILLQDVSGADLERVLSPHFRRTDREEPFVEATHAFARSVGVGPEARTRVIIDRGGTLAFGADIVHERLGGGRLLALWLDSIYSRYGFALCEGGKEVRRATWESGELVPGQPGSETPRTDPRFWPHGKPLPEEKKIKLPSWGHDESFLFELARRRGFELPEDDQTPFQAWDPVR